VIQNLFQATQNLALGWCTTHHRFDRTIIFQPSKRRTSRSTNINETTHILPQFKFKSKLQGVSKRTKEKYHTKCLKYHWNDHYIHPNMGFLIKYLQFHPIRINILKLEYQSYLPQNSTLLGDQGFHPPCHQPSCNYARCPFISHVSAS